MGLFFFFLRLPGTLPGSLCNPLDSDCSDWLSVLSAPNDWASKTFSHFPLILFPLHIQPFPYDCISKREGRKLPIPLKVFSPEEEPDTGGSAERQRFGLQVVEQYSKAIAKLGIRICSWTLSGNQTYCCFAISEILCEIKLINVREVFRQNWWVAMWSQCLCQ